MQHLVDAAKCRSESDWLVGLNSTRAHTCIRSRHGGFNITAAGRVQTPTLAILAKREREIKAFIPEDYWEVHAEFAVQQGSYPAKWFDPNWKKSPEQVHGRERIWERTQAEQIQMRCLGKSGEVTDHKKPSRQIAPQLYDLTTLQREAPFTAKIPFKSHKLCMSVIKCSPTREPILVICQKTMLKKSSRPPARLANSIIRWHNGLPIHSTSNTSNLTNVCLITPKYRITLQSFLPGVSLS